MQFSISFSTGNLRNEKRVLQWLVEQKSKNVPFGLILTLSVANYYVIVKDTICWQCSLKVFRFVRNLQFLSQILIIRKAKSKKARKQAMNDPKPIDECWAHSLRSIWSKIPVQFGPVHSIVIRTRFSYLLLTCASAKLPFATETTTKRKRRRKQIYLISICFVDQWSSEAFGWLGNYTVVSNCVDVLCCAVTCCNVHPVCIYWNGVVVVVTSKPLHGRCGINQYKAFFMPSVESFLIVSIRSTVQSNTHPYTQTPTHARTHANRPLSQRNAFVQKKEKFSRIETHDTRLSHVTLWDASN